MSKKKSDGLNESILGWLRRVHPEELWAVKGMPTSVTFKDMEKSMAAGRGMGDAEHHSDTATRELMLNRLAELLNKDVDELIDWCNANFRERARREYREKMSPRLAKPKPDKILINAGKAHVALQKVSGLLSGVDCLALADGLGKDGIDELRGILRFMKSQIEDAEATVSKASGLL